MLSAQLPPCSGLARLSRRVPEGDGRQCPSVASRSQGPGYQGQRSRFLRTPLSRHRQEGATGQLPHGRWEGARFHCRAVGTSCRLSHHGLCPEPPVAPVSGRPSAGWAKRDKNAAGRIRSLRHLEGRPHQSSGAQRRTAQHPLPTERFGPVCGCPHTASQLGGPEGRPCSKPWPEAGLTGQTFREGDTGDTGAGRSSDRDPDGLMGL